MMPDAARRRIEALAASSDPIDQEVARASRRAPPHSAIGQQRW